MPIVIKAGHKPADAFGLYRDKPNPFSPISGAAPKPLTPEEQEYERASKDVAQRNQATTQSYEQMNTAEPGRYEMVDDTALSAWQTDWEARQPNWLQNIGHRLGGAAAQGVAPLLEGLGENVRSLGNSTTTPIINRVFGTNYGEANILDAPAEWLDTLGEKTKEGASVAFKEAIANSSPDGDFFNPSTWTAGKSPSLEGYFGLALDVFGQMTPVIAASIIGGPIAGAAVGGIQGGGSAAMQADTVIDEMAQEPGLIEKESAYYRELIAAGRTHEEALDTTKAAARQAAFWMTAPISALGGFATGKLIDPATVILQGKNIAARIAGRAGLSALEEGSQEAAESIAGTTGINASAGTNLDVTEGTFGDFVLGALAGGGTGAAAGAFSKREGAASDASVAQNSPSVAQNPGSETQNAGEVAPNADTVAPSDGAVAQNADTATPGGRPAGVLTRAREHGIATAPDAAAGVELVVNDPSLPGQGAGVLHGQTVRVSPNQSGVDPTMLNVTGEDGAEQLVAKRLLQDTTGAKLVPDPQGLDTPLVTNKGQNTLAPAGTRAIVTAPGMPEFVGQIQEYIETPDGLEALVSDDQGELLQIPASFLSVSTQTKDQAFEEELQENPPLPPTEPVQQTGTVREIRNGQGQPTNLDFPDETHAKLFDFGRERATIKGLNRVTGEGGGLAIRDYAPERAKELADLLGVSQDRVAGIADDYRYRAERAARTGTAKNVSKMHSLDAEKLKGWQRERAKSDLVAPEDALSAEERSAFAGFTTDEEVRKSVYDRASETMFPDQADHVANRAVERWNADRAADAQLSAQAPNPVEDDAATWWGKLPLGARKAALASAGVKRNEKSGWSQFTKPIQTKLKIVQGEFAAVDIARQRMRKADPTPGAEISTPAPIEVEADTAQNITDNIPSSVSAPIDAAANEAATSPANDLAEPTAAQKESMNYRMGHYRLAGFDFTIENPAGSQRKGVDRGGKAWAVTMPAHYGYIKGTIGADKDHLDAYINPGTESLDDAAPVFAINQIDAETGKFDEIKTIFGATDLAEARAIYEAGFSDGSGPSRIGDIARLSVQQFREFIRGGGGSKRIRQGYGGAEIVASSARAQRKTRDERDAGIPVLAEDEATLPQSEVQGLPSIRGSRDNDPSGMDKGLRGVLPGSGAQANAASLNRQDQGSTGLPSGERPLGDPSAAVTQSSQVHSGGERDNSSRSGDSGRTKAVNGLRETGARDRSEQGDHDAARDGRRSTEGVDGSRAVDVVEGLGTQDGVEANDAARASEKGLERSSSRADASDALGRASADSPRVEPAGPAISPVNGKPLQNDAGNTLVLMACAQAKIATDKPVPLLELYNGPLWQDLRSKRGGIPERNLFAMSGKLGLTSVSTFAMPYEEKISAEKVNAFVERPITKGAPTKPGTAGPSSPFASIVREGNPFTQVIIYGSGDYRRAFDYLTAELIAAGAITVDAPIVAAEGSILQQRKQFNKYLRDVNGTDKAVATQNTAIEADMNELPTPAEAKATPPVQKQLDQTTPAATNLQEKSAKKETAKNAQAKAADIDALPKVPSFAEFRAALPIDEQGDPDLDGVGRRILDELAGAGSVWASLSDSQKRKAVSAVSRKYSMASPAPVAVLDGTELKVAFNGPEDMPALRKAAVAWYDNNLVGGTATMSDGTVVSFNKRGRRESTHGGKGDFLLRSIPAIKAIIEKGEVVLREPGDRPNVAERLVVTGSVSLNGEIKSLAVSIHKTPDGQFHYDFTMDRGSGGPGVSVPGRLTELSSEEVGSEGAPANVNLVEWRATSKGNSESRGAPEGWGSVENLPEQLRPDEIENLNNIVRQVSGLSKVEWRRRIIVEGGNWAWGTDTRMEAAGFYDPHRDVIALTTQWGNPTTAYHEAFHRLQWAFLTDKERKALASYEAEFREMIVKSGRRTQEATALMALSELEADAFGVWAAGLVPEPSGFIARVWRKIRNLAHRSINALLGMGYQIPQDIFAKALSGEIAARTPLDRESRRSGKRTLANEWSMAPEFDAATSPGAAAPAGKATKPANARIQNIKDEIKGLFTDMQPSTLALVPLNYFQELKRPGMDAVDHYLKVKRLMDAYRGDKHAAIDGVAQEWRKYARLGRMGTDKAKAAALADLMHQSTLAGIDPSSTEEETVAKAGYAALRAKYTALSPSGQALYRRVRDTYREQADELDQILLDNVRKTQEIALRRAEDTYREKLEEIAENTKLSDMDRSKAKHDAQQTYASESNRAKWNMKARMTKLRTVFEASRVPEPYFPLSRFGQYYVTVRDVDGTVLSFSKREKEADRIRLERDMRAAFPNHKVESGKLAESGSARTMMDPRIVAEIETLLGDAGVDSKILDMVWQRYLETMPDLSARKRFIHRKGVAGFEGDALRTFASAQFHAAHQMARLKYGLELTELANQATDQAKKADQPVKAMQLADELGKRHEWVMNPKGNAVANAATQAMFVWHLAATPAAAILNLTQTPMLAIPILGARLGGIGMATAAIGKASTDLIRGRGTVRNAGLTAEENRAMEAFYESGMIERSQGHDLAGIGETGIGYSPGWFKFMSWISWAYHNVEVWNREVTALAAFRMAREQGHHEGKAIDIAHDLTWASHFDYSNSSRPRFMQGDFAKVALTFQSHQVNMWYRMFRDIHQSIKGETPQAKKEARYQLAGIMGMATLFGGVTGFFGYNVLVAIAGMVFDDDDDPRTFKAEMESHVVEILGTEIGGMVLYGVPGHLTGIDLTSRVGMADFFLRAPDSGSEGREYWEDFLVGALGVVPSTAINTIEGFGMMMQGDVARGIETTSPKVVKDVLKFYRYLSEGVISRNGDTVLERKHLSPLDLLVQFAGFTPAIVSETYERMGTLKDAEQRVLDERRELINRFALAVGMKDPDAKRRAIDAIRAWNKKPYARTVPITADGLTASLKSRARNRNKREDGVLIADPELGQLLRGLMPDHVY